MKFKKMFLLNIFAGLLLKNVNLSAATESEVKKGIVKITSTINLYNYSQPWSDPEQKEYNGTGCILENGKILTDACLVNDAMFIKVTKYGKSDVYQAAVVSINEGGDLALLEVNDKKFLEDVTKLSLDTTASPGDKISIYGYPQGGNELSVTSGIVSRTVYVGSSFSNAAYLATQVDAAINIGNNGGPAIKNGKIVGLSIVGFINSYKERKSNIGYVIAPDMIKRFLNAVESKKNTDFVELGVSIQNLENIDIRNSLGMTKERSGILIRHINPRSQFFNILEQGDVILAIDGTVVDNDGFIKYKTGERVPALYLLDIKLKNDKMNVQILRSGKILNKEVELVSTIKSLYAFRTKANNATYPYYIFAGISFMPLMGCISGIEMGAFTKFDSIIKDKNLKEFVCLGSILKNEINESYEQFERSVISEINGKSIYCMKDVITAIEQCTDKYLKIQTLNGNIIILDFLKAKEENDKILKMYGVKEDRTKDILG